MTRLTAGLTLFLALAGGIAAGELVYRSAFCRDPIGRLCGRGPLLALVERSGIYELDLRREIEADFDTAGIDPSDPSRALDPNSKRRLLLRLVADEKVRRVSQNETVSEAEIEHALKTLQFQFAERRLWAGRLRASGLSAGTVRRQLRDDLRARTWIEREIANAIKTDDESCRQFYAAHRGDFVQPLRIRASHLFLAAPPETSPEFVGAKQVMIDSLAARVVQGEDFSALVAQTSEDEATKMYGGDLGYFAGWRMPADFFAMVSELPVGQVSKPIRSALGFHLVRAMEIQPPHDMTYEEAKPEIALFLSNQHRRGAVEALRGRMAEHARYFASAPRRLTSSR